MGFWAGIATMPIEQIENVIAVGVGLRYQQLNLEFAVRPGVPVEIAHKRMEVMVSARSPIVGMENGELLDDPQRVVTILGKTRRRVLQCFRCGGYPGAVKLAYHSKLPVPPQHNDALAVDEEEAARLQRRVEAYHTRNRHKSLLYTYL